MITAIVKFKLPASTTQEQALALFKESAPRYRTTAGLVRKYYVIGERDASGMVAGGIYVWRSRAAAEQVYTPEWLQSVADRYGLMPDITYFDTPVIVDNEQGRIDEAA